LGSWFTYGGGVGGSREARVHAAFEAGVNFIDTANVYSGA
jgi:aryl-alcohol dehydrogenase-like predicted oxidoreductase